MTAAGSGGAPEYRDGMQHTPGQETAPTESFGPAAGPLPGTSSTYRANPGTAEPRRWKGVVAAALIAGVIGGGIGVGGGMIITDGGGSSLVLSQHDPVTGTQINAQTGTVQYAAGKASSSTVDITVRGSRSGSEGTGVVLTPDGYVLTNNHVIGSGGEITVTLPDGTTRSASVVGTSPSYDLAVIKLNGASGLTPAELGKSSELTVGQPVVAIGSPLGLEARP
ncbi:trypsin-like serine protease [Saccharopolyspora sp. ASAGF58]|nr:trypsin-like serine protease [Saccharopolyspora sp. ASAGF58]